MGPRVRLRGKEKGDKGSQAGVRDLRERDEGSRRQVKR